MAFKEPLKIGSKVLWDGDPYKICAFVGTNIRMESAKGQAVLVDMNALMSMADFRLLDVADARKSVTTFPDNIPEQLLTAAQELLAHLLEAMTGYRSGYPETAQKNEPRQQYDPSLTNLKQRMRTKAQEMGITWRSLWMHKRAYEQYGLVGLVDKRYVRDVVRFRSVDPRVYDAIYKVFAKLVDASTVSKLKIRREVANILKAQHGDEVKLPSEATFNRLLNELARGRSMFGSAKNRRSIANRPKTPYQRFRPARPGEVILIDTTPLDAFAIDPLTLRWIQIQLTLALDLYTRSIVAWRLTPVSTLAVDAALLLFDIIRPKKMRPGWPAQAQWPYVGVPDEIVIEVIGQGDKASDLAGIPFMHPETVVVDRGRIFTSQAFRDACARLGINVQLARPCDPTDKSHIERIFRTIRERFVEHLPGYKGPDVFSRGKDIESQAVFFLDEVEEIFAEWVASYWQRRDHDGLWLEPMPTINISPNEMYQEGIARAGFVYVVPDQNLYYELLPTEWRTIQHYGVEIDGLIYDGDILDDYRNTTSPHSGVFSGKWPIRYDPRRKHEVFFFDPALKEWHPLHWVGAEDPDRPFNDGTLAYAKALVIQNGGNPRNQEELERILNHLLNRIDEQALISRKEVKVAIKRAMQTELAKKDLPNRVGAYLPVPENTITHPFMNQYNGEELHPDDAAASTENWDIKIYKSYDGTIDDSDFI